MGVLKWGAAGAIAVSMVASSAFAAEPSRSAQALPEAQSAPVSGVRSAAPLHRKSQQSDAGSPAIGYALAAVVGAGIVAATIVGTDNDSDYHQPSSPG